MSEPGGPGSLHKAEDQTQPFERALFIFIGCQEINGRRGTEEHMGREEGKRNRERSKSLLRVEK